jgi:isoquinoline 1-oxidoreductase subunit beta
LSRRTPNAGHDSTTYRAELEATAREPGKVVRNHGDVDNALASAARRVAADYFVPYLARAQMGTSSSEDDPRSLRFSNEF